MFKTPKSKKKVTILGQDISIVIDDKKLIEEEADALYEKEIIYLQSKYKDRKDYQLALRHECVHALCDLLGLQLEDQAEEVLAHRVSYMFTYEISDI